MEWNEWGGGTIRTESGPVSVVTCNSNLKIDKVFYFSPFTGFCICCLLFCRSTLQLLSNCERFAHKQPHRLQKKLILLLVLPSPLPSLLLPSSLRICFPFVDSFIQGFFFSCEANKLKPFLNVRQRSIVAKRKLLRNIILSIFG